MKHVDELRIKQVHDDCHYETSIEERMRSGFMPIVIGYGCTQEEADTEALKKFSLRQIDEDNKRFLGMIDELEWKEECKYPVLSEKLAHNRCLDMLRNKVNKG